MWDQNILGDFTRLLSKININLAKLLMPSTKRAVIITLNVVYKKRHSTVSYNIFIFHMI